MIKKTGRGEEKRQKTREQGKEKGGNVSTNEVKKKEKRNLFFSSPIFNFLT